MRVRGSNVAAACGSARHLSTSLYLAELFASLYGFVFVFMLGKGFLTGDCHAPPGSPWFSLYLIKMQMKRKKTSFRERVFNRGRKRAVKPTCPIPSRR